ncbi:MAG TPA: hypothetical protein VMU39_21015 [Solirubrobacteraceae bacterium]|nr:hypothetical protein [Solirubrobacteraceae bacterium]
MPLGARALLFVRTLPDHRVLDRLIRGRAWIPVLGAMLAGIVAMQVEVLKLGASFGRSIGRTATLQASNEVLRESVAALDGDARIESLAAQQGMVMPQPGGVGFLSAGNSGSDVSRAIANIHAPDPASFLALTTTNGTVATGLNGAATTVAGLAAAGASTAGALVQPASQSPATTSSQTLGGTTAQTPSAATPAQSATTGAGTSTGAATGTSPSASGTSPSASGTATATANGGATGTSPSASGTSPSVTGTASGASAGAASSGPGPTATPVSSPAQSGAGAATTGGASVPVGG